MVNTEVTQPRDIAVSLLAQGKSAAEVWSALVSSGVEPAAAEALVKELIELRRTQIESQRKEEERIGTGFCKKCYDESTRETPGNTFSINGIGTTFYGRDRGCKDCGSVVRVHWAVFFGIPLVPGGTYRYRTIRNDGLLATGTRFVARRTQTNSAQIALHYAAAAPVVLFLIALIVIVTR